MPTHRYPVLVCQDHAGHVTGVLVDDPDVAAVAASPEEAIREIETFLRWRLREHDAIPAPELVSPRLVELAVSVRPEYREDERVFACEEEVRLRVACVTGKRPQGLYLAAIPLLDVRFTYHEETALRDLVTHYVRDTLKGSTPRRLARHLPPARVELREAVVRASGRGSKTQPDDTLPPTLAAVSDPLRKVAGARAYGREPEVTALSQTLLEKGPSVLLVGEAGVGKTAILLEAVRRVDRKRGRFFRTSAGRLIAGMKYLGQWEARLEVVIDELSARDGVLCVDRLLDLVRMGGRGPADSLAAFLVPYLEHGELRLVAEATPRELEACRRLLPGFAGLFQVVTVEAFDRAEALAVLSRLIAAHSQRTGIEAEGSLPETVHRLFTRFEPYSAFPGRAAIFCERLFDELAGASGRVGADKAVALFTRRTGLPETMLRDDLMLDQDDVAASLAEQVLGQAPACRLAAEVVTTLKAGLNDPERPVAVLLFCGPTGVGKTRLAQVLAQHLFGHGEEGGDRIIRLDMSEYATWGAATRLVEGPSGEPSALIQHLRTQPFAVVLFDEIEKASPDVFDVLLSVLDEGRLTDAFGRVTTFRSAIVILTSNLGADSGRSLGFTEGGGASFEDAVRAFFRPELFNRIDEVVAFGPLTADVVRAITRKELREVTAREGLERRGVRLTIDGALEEALAAAGFDPRYGARPLQRALEERLVTPLARFLVERDRLRDVEVRATLGADGLARFEVL